MIKIYKAKTINKNYKENKKIKLGFLGFPIISTLLMYIYYINQITFFMAIGLIIFIIPVILYESSYIFYILLFTVSNERLFRTISGGQSFIAILIVFLAIKIFLENKRRINKKVLICYLLILIFMLTKSIMLSKLELSLDLIRFMLNSYILVTIIDVNKTNIETLVLNSMLFYIYGILLTSFLSLYHKIVLGNTLSIITTNRFAGLRNDPNYYSVSVALAISIMIILYFTRNKNRVASLIIIITLTLFGSLSISKGFLVANIPNLILIFLLAFNSKKKKKLILTILIIAAVIMLLKSQNTTINMVYSQYLKRFETRNLDSGRLDLWSTYINLLTANSKNLLFGLGRFDNILFSLNYNIKNVAHNIIVGSLAANGLLITVVIIITLIIIYILIKKKFKITNWRFYSNMPLIVIFIGYFFLDAITSNIFIYGFGLSVMSGYILHKSNENIAKF